MRCMVVNLQKFVAGISTVIGVCEVGPQYFFVNTRHSDCYAAVMHRIKLSCNVTVHQSRFIHIHYYAVVDSITLKAVALFSPSE